MDAILEFLMYLFSMAAVLVMLPIVVPLVFGILVLLAMGLIRLVRWTIAGIVMLASRVVRVLLVVFLVVGLLALGVMVALVATGNILTISPAVAVIPAPAVVPPAALSASVPDCWPKGAGDAYDAIYLPCPAGDTGCFDLQPQEIVPYYEGGVLVRFDVTREGDAYSETHVIPHFYMRNPCTAMQYGWMHLAEDRGALGLSAEELEQLGYAERNLGAGIPGLYQGSVEGLSFYLDQSEELGKLAAQTVEERLGQAWSSETWIRTHFQLGSDAKMEHQGGKAWHIEPAAGHTTFRVCNPDPVWYDGWRAVPGNPRPGWIGAEAKRIGVEPATSAGPTCLEYEGASLAPSE